MNEISPGEPTNNQLMKEAEIQFKPIKRGGNWRRVLVGTAME